MNHDLKPASSERGAKYCVPTAMAAVTHLSPRECRLAVETYTRRKQPRGIRVVDYYATLLSMGFRVKGTAYSPTSLGRVIKKLQHKAIIVIESRPGSRSTHAIAYHNGYICENQNPKPIQWRYWVRKRYGYIPRVTHVTEILS